jgi:gas vesicle protein
MARLKLFVVVVLLVSSLNVARADTWSDVGGALRTACGITGGGNLPGGIQLGGISNLDFLCTISRMYGFVNNAILGGDWQSFAREVAGRWITDMANYAAKDLGLNSVNQWTAAADDWMRGTYREFKRSMMYAVSDAIRNQLDNPRDDNARLPVSTAGGLASLAIRENPVLAGAQIVGQTARTAQAFEQIRQAKKIQDMEATSAEAIETNVGEVTKKATQVMGIPGLGNGASEQFVNAARTASSTREVMVQSVEATSALMNQLATYNVGLMNQLSVMAKQDVMTNSQLMQLVTKLQGEQQSSVDSLELEVEAEAQRALEEGKDLATQLRAITRQGQAFYNPNVGQGVDPLQAAP